MAGTGRFTICLFVVLFVLTLMVILGLTVTPAASAPLMEADMHADLSLSGLLGTGLIASADRSIRSDTVTNTFKTYFPYMERGVLNVCGEIITDTVWTAVEGPYKVTCDVNIFAGVTLTIEAGTRVEFQSPWDDLNISGTLQAVGTEQAPIFFQPADETAVGSWGRIAYMPGSSGVLDHTTLEYGGSVDGMLYIASDAVQVVNSVVQFSADTGIYIHEASPLISHTQILSNGGVTGGGLYNDSGGPTIQNNIFMNNVAYYGGGLYNGSGSSIVQNNVFTHNFGGFGAGLYNLTGNLTIQSNIFTYNYAENEFGGSGGGLYNVSGNLSIQNNVFANNTANYYGSGGGLWTAGASTIQNNTFYGNSAISGGGVFISSGNQVLRNNIVVNNARGGIVNNAGTSMLDYNDVWNNIGGDYENVTPGAQDISADPLLVDPAKGDFHLSAGSPCIDAGDPVNYPPFDFEGDPRPNGAAPDIGADEYYARME